MKDDAAAEHARRVADMFGRIAGPYDALNRALSLGVDRIWRKKLAGSVDLSQTGRALDLAAGTLDVSLALCKEHPHARVFAVDFALPMLHKGLDKLDDDGRRRIAPVQADGRRLPFDDEVFDGATIAFGIRNILPRSQAYEEILRVLTPGGRLCILEFGGGKKKIWKGLYNFYLGRLLPEIGGLVSGDKEAYRYLAASIGSFPSPHELGQEIKAAGFDEVTFRPLWSGIVNIHIARKSMDGKKAARA